ncbi:hypothetical protein Hanom_Chr15g01411951 [Helianthus anomalus]
MMMDDGIDDQIDDQHLQLPQGPLSPMDALHGHPYMEFPDGTDAAAHCMKLRRMHIGQHLGIDWDAPEKVGETARAREFVPMLSP